VAETITVKKTGNHAKVQQFEIRIAALATTQGVELPGLNTVILIGVLAAAGLVLFLLLKFRILSLQKVHVEGSKKGGGKAQEPVKSEGSSKPDSSDDSDLPSLAPDTLTPKTESKKGLSKEPKMEVFKSEKAEDK
jgi:hypothetical protein